jgi:NAD(P) transhydrogenase
MRRARRAESRGSMSCDLIVVGSAIEGVYASLSAASAGLEVALVDTSGMGRERVFAPGPLLLSLLHETLLGIHAACRLIVWQQAPHEVREMLSRALLRGRDALLEEHFAGLRARLAAAGVRLLSGPARFTDPGRIELENGEEHRARRTIIATGARARRPARFPFDGRVLCDSDELLRGSGLPRTLLVIGADQVGCEFSCLFAALGTSVTLLDRRTRLLRFVDAELRRVLHDEMRRTGISVVLGERVERVEHLGSGEDAHARVVLGSGRVEVADRVLVAAGALANVDDLDLARAGVALGPRGIAVADDGFQTTAPGVYAIGGAVEPLTPVEAAIHQGRSVALRASGVSHDACEEVPLVIHCVPEIGTIGLSEEACRHLGIACLTARAELRLGPGARVRGESAGLLKLAVDPLSERLLGVQAIGSRAAEVVNLAAALMRKQATLSEIAGVGFSPGSPCEAYHLAALAGLEQLPEARTSTATR